MLTPGTTASPGQFARWRARWLGTRDPVADQLRDIARQGAGMARLAHGAAFLLIILFSLLSLIALANDALATVAQQWSRGQGLNIPDTITVGVSVILVICFDIGMLYAAGKIRVLIARRAPRGSYWLHISVMTLACLLEAGTYAYAAYLYDHPSNPIAWGLIILRALSAPIFAIYLSMSQTMPVGVDDITHQVGLAAGMGAIQGMVALANDPTAPLSKKVALFAAAEDITAVQQKRIDKIMAVLNDWHVRPVVDALPAPTRTYAEQYPDEEDDSDFTKTNAVLAAVNIAKAGRNGHNPDDSSYANSAMHDGPPEESGPRWRSKASNIATPVRSITAKAVAKPRPGGRNADTRAMSGMRHPNRNTSASSAVNRRPLRREPARPKIVEAMASSPHLTINGVQRAIGVNISVASRRHPDNDSKTKAMLAARRRELGYVDDTPESTTHEEEIAL
jgi:hypothetical protein